MASTKTVKGAAKTVKGKGKPKAPPAPVGVSLVAHANGAAFSEARPGVVAVIIESLVNATRDKPVTKKEICARVLALHGEGAYDGARMSTVKMQVPCQAKSEKGLIIASLLVSGTNEKAYFCDIDATAAHLESQFSRPVDQARQWPAPFCELLAKAREKVKKANAKA